MRVRAAGRIYVRSTWTDRRAILQTEIWRGPFRELLATGVRHGDELCVLGAADVDVPGVYVVRTCHAPGSATPICDFPCCSSQDDYATYQLTAFYP